MERLTIVFPKSLHDDSDADADKLTTISEKVEKPHTLRRIMVMLLFH